MIEELKGDLIRDEGSRLKPYRDSVGKLTIGIGHNLDDKGISKEIENAIYLEDINEVFDDLDKNIPWWRNLDEVRQRVIANMCFNMGWPVLSQFKTTLGHVRDGDYEAAADSMMQSLWAKQVGSRAMRLEYMMRNGKNP